MCYLVKYAARLPAFQVLSHLVIWDCGWFCNSKSLKLTLGCNSFSMTTKWCSFCLGNCGKPVKLVSQKYSFAPSIAQYFLLQLQHDINGSKAALHLGAVENGNNTHAVSPALQCVEIASILPTNRGCQ